VNKTRSKQPTDTDLIAKVLAGDVEAYGEILARYEPLLLRYVTYRLGDPSLARDVVQDTFIKAYQNLHSFRTGSPFSSWIYRIAHNEAINTIKKETRHRRTDIDSLPDLGYEPRLDELVDTTITNAQMHNCLRELDSRYQEVIQLAYLEHMSYENVSDILHVPVSTVGVWLLRAKAKLRTICQKRGVHP